MRSIVLNHVIPSFQKFLGPKLQNIIPVLMMITGLMVNEVISEYFAHTSKFIVLYPTIFIISYLYGSLVTLTTIMATTAYVFLFQLERNSGLTALSYDDIFHLVVFVSSTLLVAWITRKGRLTDRALKRNNEILRDLLNSQREVMRDMKAAEERLRLATSVSKVGIWEWNLITSEYTTTLQHDLIFGFKDKTPFWSYALFKRKLHPLDREKVTLAIDNAVSIGTDFEIDFRILLDNGAIRWVRKFGKVELAPDGGPHRVIGTCMDITEQRVSEDAMKEALFYRDEFLSIASHELKTPLTSLKLQAQVYKRSLSKSDRSVFGPEKMQRLVDHVDVQVNRLVRLVDDMLDISRIRTGNLSMIKNHFDIHDLVGELVERMRPSMNSFDQITFKSQGNLIVHGDHMRIEQVISNLLNNALRYGKGNPISVNLSYSNQEAFISIKDQGIGIAKEDQFKIFNRFQRAVPAREVSGLGLGLYITKEIINAHGGVIELDSEIGKGSTFTVKIPTGSCV